MKTRHTTLAVMAALLLLSLGCRVDDPCDDCWEPPPPSGVWTITGDGYVEILWDELYIHDLEGYRIYRSDSEYGDYWRIGWTYDSYFIDEDVFNGHTYYYAVTAMDYDGNESELSYETIHDTPRPADFGLEVWDYDDEAGVDFSGYYYHMIQPWDEWDTDMYLFWDSEYETFAFASTDVVIGDDVLGTDIQYAGWVESLDELDWAPEGGWTTEYADVVLLYEGHAYWVWTWDNHFAKFMVVEIGWDYVVLDWAYQVDEGNPELDLIPGGEGPGDSIKPPRGGVRTSVAPETRPCRIDMRDSTTERR